MNFHKRFFKTLSKFKELFGCSPIMYVSAILLTILSIGLALFLFFNSAAPSTVRMTTGPEGSAFSYFADKYKKLLEQEGINLILLPSKGSLDNLKKLANDKDNVLRFCVRSFLHTVCGFRSLHSQDFGLCICFCRGR